MKRLVLLLSLVSSLSFAEGMNDARIADVKAEIAQRQSVIDQMKADGKPTGRAEMAVFRLKVELEKLEGMNIPLAKN
jgi:hypothetical protein